MGGLQNPGVPHLHDVVVLSSTDEEEANRDLTLDILERARCRGEKRQMTKKNKRKKSKQKVECDGVVVDLITTSSDELEVLKKSKKGRKRTKKLEKPAKIHETVVLDAVDDAEGVVGHRLEEVGGEPHVINVNEPHSPPPPNEVLRKLLRIPRYFDSEGSSLMFCSNCSEDGHVAANCRLERRKKPCFVCGILGHDARKCPQGYECFMCKRRGHSAKNCPDKVKNTLDKNSKLCLRCGDLGHDMTRCINSYDPEDLEEIQCYVCKGFGHLCCMDATGTNVGSAVVACYNCGLTGHSGLGCNNKEHFQTNTVDSSPKACYKCGEEGHFARGCSKNVKGSRSKVRSQIGIGDSRIMCFKCGVEGHLKRDCPMKQKTDKFSDEPKTPSMNPRILRNGDHFESRSAPPNKRYNDGGSFGHDGVNYRYHDNNGNHDEWRLSNCHKNSQIGRGFICTSSPTLYSNDNRQMSVNYRANQRYRPDHGQNYHNFHPAAGYRAASRFNNHPANHHWN